MVVATPIDLITHGPFLWAPALPALGLVCVVYPVCKKRIVRPVVRFTLCLLVWVAAFAAFWGLWWATGQPQSTWAYTERQRVVSEFANRLAQANPQQRQELLQTITQDMRQRLSQVPEDLSGHLLLAKLYGMQGDWKSAVAIYHDFFKAHAEDPGFLQGYIRALYERDQRVFSAITANLVEKLRVLAPSDPDTLVFSALLFWQQGNTEAAKADWQALTEQMPDGPEKDRLLRQIAKLTASKRESD